MSTTTKQFDHQRIAKIRRQAGLTQRVLSQKSGVPLDTLRQYEQGRSTPSVDRLFTIASTLRCKVDDFATEARP